MFFDFCVFMLYVLEKKCRFCKAFIFAFPDFVKFFIHSSSYAALMLLLCCSYWEWDLQRTYGKQKEAHIHHEYAPLNFILHNFPCTFSQIVHK